MRPRRSPRCALTPKHASPPTRRRPMRSGCASTPRSTPRAWPAGPSTCTSRVTSPSSRRTEAGRSRTTARARWWPIPLIDLKRLGIYVKEYVYRLEHCVLQTLEGLGVTGHRVPGAPGIYVRLDDPFGHAPLERVPPNERLGVAAPNAFQGLGKIAALGIKVSRHCAYHGVAFNVPWTCGPSSASTLAATPGWPRSIWLHWASMSMWRTWRSGSVPGSPPIWRPDGGASLAPPSLERPRCPPIP